MKQRVNNTLEEQKQHYRKQLNVDPIKINNYSPKVVIDPKDAKKTAMGGFTLLELIEKELKSIQTVKI
jgi:hypothetical protein